MTFAPLVAASVIAPSVLRRRRRAGAPRPSGDEVVIEVHAPLSGAQTALAGVTVEQLTASDDQAYTFAIVRTRHLASAKQALDQHRLSYIVLES